MTKVSIKDLELKGKTVFIRVDFNVPLTPDGKEITSDKRIRASLPTIRYATRAGRRRDFGQPSGTARRETESRMSLAPVAIRLSELLGKRVAMAPDCVGPEVAAMKPTAWRSSIAREPPLSPRRGSERSRVFEAARVACATCM